MVAIHGLHDLLRELHRACKVCQGVDIVQDQAQILAVTVRGSSALRYSIVGARGDIPKISKI